MACVFHKALLNTHGLRTYAACEVGRWHSASQLATKVARTPPPLEHCGGKKTHCGDIEPCNTPLGVPNDTSCGLLHCSMYPQGFLFYTHIVKGGGPVHLCSVSKIKLSGVERHHAFLPYKNHTTPQPSPSPNYLSSSRESCHDTAARTASPWIRLSALKRRSAVCRQRSLSRAAAALSRPFRTVAESVSASCELDRRTCSSSRHAAAASPRSVDACRRNVLKSNPGGGARQGASSGAAGGGGGNTSCIRVFVQAARRVQRERCGWSEPVEKTNPLDLRVLHLRRFLATKRYALDLSGHLLLESAVRRTS